MISIQKRDKKLVDAIWKPWKTFLHFHFLKERIDHTDKISQLLIEFYMIILLHHH